MSTLSTSPLSQSTHHSTSISPLKRKAMSVTQTYYLAHTARGKLSSEAARADHNLRLLVGHANLLDSLMLELAEAEQEQESWFNQSVKKAAKTTEEPKHIQWADTIVEDPEEDWQADDAASDSSDDSDYDSEDEDMEMEAAVASVVQQAQTIISQVSVEEDEEYEDDEEDNEGLSLHRIASHAAYPPELDHDSDSSEDEAMPPSPPSDTLPSFSEKQAIATTSYYAKSSPSIPPSEQQAFFEEGFYLPPRGNPSLISAISVY
jgi:hypothetical protein